MITRERLQELIKQGALIYLVSSIDNEIYSMQLNSYFTINSSCLVDEGGYWYKLDELFETKDRAEWALKTTTERTERFEPPMWEDLVTPYQFTFILRCKKDSRDMGTYALYVYQSGIMIEEDIEAHAQHYLFDKDFTKENYIKACEIVRDLFNKGGV